MSVHSNSSNADEAVRAPSLLERGRPRPPRLSRHIEQLAALLCVISCCSSFSLAQTPEPFRRLRESTLTYQGTDTDFTNLTEIRIGWFGPTNLDDPLNGDLWWAANFAIKEANALASADGSARSADLQSAVSRISNPQDARNLSTPRIFTSLAESNSAIQQTASLRYEEFARLPVRLIPRWAVDPWGTGVSQLTRMVYEEQPLALLGSVDSATTHLAEQVVAKANLPLVSPIATDKSVTLAGVPWMFSCAPSDAAIARVLVEAVLADLKTPADKLVLFAATDHESRMTAREVVRELTRRGRRPNFRFEVPPGADFTKQLQAAAEARPALVLIVAETEDAARLTKAVREKLGSAVVFGSHAMSRRCFAELAGSAADGVRFPLLFVPNSADTNLVRFVASFTTARHHAPDYTAALTYDATRLLIAAIHHAGPNRARIRESLTQLSPWSGFAGTIRFDGTGQNTRTNISLGVIQNGAIVPLPGTAFSTTPASNTAKQ